MPALLIQRIQASLASGELPPATYSASEVSFGTIGDLVRPWSEIYPEVELSGEAGDELDLPSYAGFGSRLRHPRFVPRVKRSAGILPWPSSPEAPAKLASPGFIASMKAIWDFYQAKKVASPELLDLPIDDEAMSRFTEQLGSITGNYWPLGANLDELGLKPEDIFTGDGICLWLPHETYECDGVQAFEAFLSGPESVASLLEDMYPQKPNDSFYVSDQDRRLVSKIGIAELVQNYHDYVGKKSVDLSRFAYDNWFDNFFGGVKDRFPRQMDREWPIISGDGGQDAELWIRSAADIYFALDYAEAWYDMIRELPCSYDFMENEDGIAEKFLHEVCEVWRKSGKQRKARAEAKAEAAKKTLLERYQEGDL